MPCLRLLFVCLLCAIMSAVPLRAVAQPETISARAAPAPGSGTEHRVALVIGNAAYRDSPLKNPVNDARAMRDKLKGMGFEVVYFENLQTRQVGSALREFRNAIRPGSVALFFYAGHGLQVRGENYLPTVDAELSSEEDVPNQSLSLSAVLNTMEDSKANVNLVLLDACRNNPYARNFRSAPRGLARVQAPSGTLIHYATRPGSVAEDGSGSHGTYTEALLTLIDEKGVPIETSLKRVTIRVRDATKGKQEPWMEGSLTGEFYFIVNGNPQITVQQVPASADAAAWQAADSINTVAAYQAYLVEYPSGLYAAAARIKLASLRAPSSPATALVAPQPAAAAPFADASTPSLLTAVPAGVKDADGFIWRDVQARGGKEHYEAYLQQRPNGRYAATARAQLKAIALRETRLEAQQRVEAEPQVWASAQQSHTEEAYQIYLQAYPKGRFVAQANAAMKLLRQPPVVTASVTAVAPAVVRPGVQDRQDRQDRQLPAAEREALRTAALREMNLARLSGADYPMGAEPDELGEGGLIDEMAQPQHSVKVANFELGYTEVSVAQFRKFVDATGYLSNAESPTQPGCQVPAKGGRWVLQPTANWRAPGHAQSDSHPVVCVSWNDVQAYLQWLNNPAERFRLPSEAEWEFAARAGTTTPRPWSDTAGFFARTWNTVKPWSADRASRACKYANVADQSLREQLDWQGAFDCSDGYPLLVPVSYFARNNFGLYDMMGNAAEWTQDCWNPNHAGAPRDARARNSGDCSRHVVRGGSWASSQASIRSAARHSQPQNYRASDLGFRLARTP